MKNFDFHASIGDVETYTPWRRPNMLRLADWWKEWGYLPAVADYEVYLAGAVAEQKWGIYTGLTWDVDIILVGEVNNTKELKYLMDEGYRIGWNNHICMDMIWSSDLFCCINQEFKPYSWIRNGSKFTKNRFGEITQHYYSEYACETYTLDDGLFQYVYYEPPLTYKKVQRRIEFGEYLGIFQNLKEFFD
jgi:hypothetical protein